MGDQGQGHAGCVDFPIMRNDSLKHSPSICREAVHNDFGRGHLEKVTFERCYGCCRKSLCLPI